jgi:hypothetical protein
MPAVELRDGTEFSMRIDDPSVRVCVIEPAAQRDPQACAGLALEHLKKAPPLPGFAWAIVRVGASEDVAFVVLQKAADPIAEEPDQRAADLMQRPTPAASLSGYRPRST